MKWLYAMLLGALALFFCISCLGDAKPSPGVTPAGGAAGTGTPASPGAVTLPKTEVNPKDGAEMVLVPAGEFLMGSRRGVGSDDEHPQHKVWLDDYYISKYEVTNEQFAKFVKEKAYITEAEQAGDRLNWKKLAKPGLEKHPVVDVSWNDAVAYCAWAGVSLPTEAQWEKAARGTGGREYPWGNSWEGSKCNWYGGPKVAGMADMYEKRGTTPMGSFPSGASPYGLVDMAGNVWEWCSDWYGEDYYKGAPARNPGGPEKGEYRVLRGGSWGDAGEGGIRCALRGRNSPVSRLNYYGFRTCRFSNTPSR
jgi:formylglycine-generating enzyme required for sulfatase activity